MPSFTEPQIRVMETALEENPKIAVNRLVNMLKEQVPGVSGAYAEKVTGFVDEWKRQNPIVGNTMPEINIHASLPDATKGFELPAMLDAKQLAEADRKLASLEDYYSNMLLTIQQGRKGLEDASKAIQMLYQT